MGTTFISKTIGWGLYALLAISMFGLSTRQGPPFSTLEAVGFLAGLVWIWFLIKENPWGWLAGITSSTAYVVLFYQGKLFGDAALNLLYVVLGILGWYWWSKGIEHGKHLRIGRVKLMESVLLAIGVAVGASLLIPHFRNGGSPVPIPDAILFCTALSAQFLQAQKKIENWPLWIIVNSGYVAVYIYREYYATAVLTSVYALMAIKGWIDWISRIRLTNKEDLQGAQSL